MIRIFPSLLLGAFLFMCLSSRAEESFGTNFTSIQQEELLSGKKIKIEEEIPGNPWPRFSIYQLVKSSPENVAAVFWNCELDPEYIPNCLSVRILKRPSPGVIEAEYTLKMPFFLPNEVYISRNELTSPSPSTYMISWQVDKTRYIRKSQGNILLQPAHGGTLIRYTNLVEPGSKFARLLRTQAGTQVIECVGALTSQVEMELGKSSALLMKQVEELRKSQQSQSSSRSE